VALERDRLLLGPLSEVDLANDATRERYLNEIERAQVAGRFSATEDEDTTEELDGVVGLEATSPETSLLDYQAELVERILELCGRKPPNNIGLVALPTGAGKTRTAVYSVLKLIAAGSVDKILWLAPSRELLEQAVGAFRALWPIFETRSIGLDLFRCHILKDYPKGKRASVYFSTPQMLYQRLVRARAKLPIWDLIIFDEAHLAEAPTFRDALTLARELGGSETPCFGLSATSGRSKESGTDSLIGLFNRRLITSRLLGKDAFESLRQRGVLAQVDFRLIPIESKQLHVRKDAISDTARFRATTLLCAQLSKAGSTMVFAGSIRHAVALAVSLQHQGVPAAWVSGAMPARERDRTLKAFEAGVFSVLANKSLLATGYDCPAISNVVLTVPIRSAVLFEQMVGRASRGPRVGGNSKAVVWYFEDHIKWHGKPASYQRYALSGWR